MRNLVNILIPEAGDAMFFIVITSVFLFSPVRKTSPGNQILLKKKIH